jgi:hypothetical protein
MFVIVISRHAGPSGWSGRTGRLTKTDLALERFNEFGPAACSFGYNFNRAITEPFQFLGAEIL